MVQILADPNVSRTSIPSEPAPFSPTSSAVWSNALLFLSLVVSLTCALLATMLQQWARRYLRFTQRPKDNPHDRARIRAFFLHGVDTFHVSWVVEALPTLLHLSIGLFFSGILVWLFDINHPVFRSVGSWAALSASAYICITLLPIFRPNSPYCAPLSPTLWSLYTGMSYIVLKLLSSSVLRSGCRFHNLKRSYHKRFFEGLGKTTEAAACQRSSEVDVRVLISTLDAIGEDGARAKFFAAIPGFFSSDLVNDLEVHLFKDFRTRFRKVLDGFLDRTLSSNQVSGSARSEQLSICLDATHVVLGVDGVSQILFDILNGRWKELLQSVDMGHSLRRWSDSADEQYAPFVRGIVAQIIASARERDVRWISLVRQEFGIPDQVLRANIDDGDSASLSALLYMIRQAIRTGSWTPWTLSSLSQFDIRNTLPKLQHEFCCLWNDIVLEAQNDGADSIAILILKEIRHAYIRLHQGTDAAPTTFSDRTYHFDPVLTQPSTYRFCDIPDHLREWAHQHPVTKDVTFLPLTGARSTPSVTSTTQLNDPPNPPAHPIPSEIQNFPDNAGTFVISSRTNVVHTTLPQVEEANIIPGFSSSVDLAKRPPDHAPPRIDAFSPPFQFSDPVDIAQRVLPASELSVPEGMGSVVAYEGTQDPDPLVSMGPYDRLPHRPTNRSESPAIMNLTPKNDDNLPCRKPDISDGGSVNASARPPSAEDR